MNYDIVLGLVIGAGVGYLVAKHFDNLPVMTSGGKPMDGTKIAASAYRLGVADGETRTAQYGNDAQLVTYLQTLS
jgi:hypothetical protein